MTHACALMLVSCLMIGCAGNGSTRASSPYERICGSSAMTPAAGREAFWCWSAMGARSYEEWLELEKQRRLTEGKQVARATAVERGAR